MRQRNQFDRYFRQQRPQFPYLALISRCQNDFHAFLVSSMAVSGCLKVFETETWWQGNCSSRLPLIILADFPKTRPDTGGIALAVGVKVRDNENIDRALRRFKRAVNRSRVLRIYRANMAYTKP